MFRCGHRSGISVPIVLDNTGSVALGDGLLAGLWRSFCSFVFLLGRMYVCMYQLQWSRETELGSWFGWFGRGDLDYSCAAWILSPAWAWRFVFGGYPYYQLQPLGIIAFGAPRSTPGGGKGVCNSKNKNIRHRAVCTLVCCVLVDYWLVWIE